MGPRPRASAVAVAVGVHALFVRVVAVGGRWPSPTPQRQRLHITRIEHVPPVCACRDDTQHRTQRPERPGPKQERRTTPPGI
eukprot:6532199-Prymnesium_polylepis.2